MNRAGFGDAVRFEGTKFITLPSNMALTGVLAVMLPALAVVVAATGSLQDDDTILGASVLGGAVIAQILSTSLGAVFVTGEISSGMMRTSLVACPKRLWVLAAKAFVAAAVVVAVVVPSALAAFGIGIAMLSGDDYATGRPFPALLGVGLAIGLMAVLGVAIGALVRNSAGAVLVGVAVVLLPGLVAPMLGDYQRWLGGASLDGVMRKLTQSSDASHQAVGSVGAWPSLGIAFAYTTAAVALAVWDLRRRDS